MGIVGLLPLLKSIHRPCNLKKFAGQTIGVDAYGWLHRGSISCCVELAMGWPTRKYVEFAMHRVRMLQHYGVTPYLVFDGDYLPSKAATEETRAKSRNESKRLGLQLRQTGRAHLAHQHFTKAIDVTPEMARQLIEELKRTGVQYIVAPYEADAQLAYLEKKGVISAVLSEDSDLLVYGTNCLLTKLDQYGECIEINRADFTACREISLVGWSDVDFRRMAILSGCDYLPSLTKMGLKTAYRLVRKYKVIDRILKALQFDSRLLVPEGYLQEFTNAERTFLHHRVYCPIERAMVMLSQPEEAWLEDDLLFLGPHVDPKIASGVACGDLHPMTKKPLEVARVSMANVRGPLSSRKQAARTSSDGGLDLKGSKTIGEFFKAKRTPLAELDPNCFTPSPTQERLLQQYAQESWVESPVPASRSAAGAMSSPSVAPLSMRNGNLGTLPTPPPSVRGPFSSSVARPPKRPRLCSDEKEGSPIPSTVSGETGSSRFFSNHSIATETPPSSLGKAGNRTAGLTKGDFNIFSDDSVEDALTTMGDTCEDFGSPGKAKIKVFRDHADETEMPHSQIKSQSDRFKVGRPVSAEQVFTRDGQPEETTSSADTVALAATIDDNVRKQLQRFRNPAASDCEGKGEQRSIAMPVKEQTAQLKRPLSLSAPSAASREGRVGPFRRQQISGSPTAGLHNKTTPLQRLGVSALRRVSSCAGSEPITAGIVRPEPVRSNSDTTNCRKVEPSPAVVVNGKASIGPTEGSTQMKGSEDTIVPDSDEDTDGGELSPAETVPSAVNQLDLPRFMFAPA
ncbi:MAG: Rad2 nuclease [Caeruleum heppii]|nr:MAG: Rad2 nuclease [Caeruleum heppii]